MKTQSLARWIWALLAVLGMLGTAPGQPGMAMPGAQATGLDHSLYFPLALHTSPVRIHGVAFSPYLNGQSPALLTPISESQLRARMRIVAPHAGWIRTFGMSGGLEKSGKVAHELGLKAALGAWFDRGMSQAQKDAQVANLIAAANAGEADLLILGSETLYRGDLSEQELLDYIQQVKSAIPPGIPVTTGEIFDVLLEHPAVMAAVDVLAVNMYPYWVGIPVEDAIPALNDWYERVLSVAGGKPVLISETGWPTCGNSVYGAVPSVENASRFFLNFVTWARSRDVPYFYFEAFDEGWKAAQEGPQGACWGIWTRAGELKSGMGAVFAGNALVENWEGASKIELLSLPAYGGYENLQGYTLHASPADQRVLVYIRVGGGWWIKPSQAAPFTDIRANGLWTCDITTGGSDQNATEIAAYLVPASITPPILLGAASLPAELAAYPYVHITRAP